MKYVIETDKKKRIACSTCYGTDPTHFEDDAEGKTNAVERTNNSVSRDTFDDEKIAEAKNRTDTYPVNVINVSEI
jgi:ferredoxin